MHQNNTHLEKSKAKVLLMRTQHNARTVRDRVCSLRRHLCIWGTDQCVHTFKCDEGDNPEGKHCCFMVETEFGTLILQPCSGGEVGSWVRSYPVFMIFMTLLVLA